MLREAIKQAPALVVLVIIVLLFLKYLTKRDDVHKERHKEFVSFLTVIQTEHLDARRESRDAIKENTLATHELSRTITDLRIQLRNGSSK